MASRRASPIRLCEDGQEDGGAGKIASHQKNSPLSPVAEASSLPRGLVVRPESEVGQSRFGEDRRGDREGGLNEHRRDAVGEHVLEKD